MAEVHEDNPSDWEVGSEIEDIKISPLHPVESRSWQQTREVLPRYSLDLPTEAQWDVAVMGGSPWVRVDGNTLTDLVERVDWGTHPFVDAPPPEASDHAWFPHRPAGELLPNPYGLHDTLG